jgi:hypothetical protein
MTMKETRQHVRHNNNDGFKLGKLSFSTHTLHVHRYTRSLGQVAFSSQGAGNGLYMSFVVHVLKSPCALRRASISLLVNDLGWCKSPPCVLTCSMMICDSFTCVSWKSSLRSGSLIPCNFWAHPWREDGSVSISQSRTNPLR